MIADGAGYLVPENRTAAATDYDVPKNSTMADDSQLHVDTSAARGMPAVATTAIACSSSTADSANGDYDRSTSIGPALVTSGLVDRVVERTADGYDEIKNGSLALAAADALSDNELDKGK